MCDDPRSARRSWRSLFQYEVDPTVHAPPPNSPLQSQSASGEPSSPRIAVYEKEEEVEVDGGGKASANEGVQEEEEEEEEALKADLPVSGPESTQGGKKKGKGAVVRVWSAEDEVRILECLAAYVKEHGAPPVRSVLHGVIHGHVHKRDFTLTEIYEKVRRLRDRYCNMRDKAGAAGAPPRGDAEDLHKYEISSKIWGDSLVLRKPENKGGNGSNKAPKTPRVRRDFKELQEMYPHLTLTVEEIAAGHRGCLKRAYELMDDTKARELDVKIKKLRVLEMQMQQDRSSSRMEVMRALLE